MPTMIGEDVYNMYNMYNVYKNSTSAGNIGVAYDNIGSTSIAADWKIVGEYCDNDVIATEAVFNHLQKEGNMKKVEYNAMFKRNKIKNVIFNAPATIVFWSDGTKTVVKCGENDIYDPEKGLAMAVAKKYLGTNKSHSNYMDEFKKWLPKDEWQPDPFEDFRDSIKKLAEIGDSLKEKDND